MLLSRSGCETTSQCAQVRYFSIIIFSSLVSQRQTTQQSRESDIVGDDGEATTTFVSKNCSTSGCVHVYYSPSLSLSLSHLPLLPFLLLLPLVFLLLPLLPSFLFSTPFSLLFPYPSFTSPPPPPLPFPSPPPPQTTSNADTLFADMKERRQKRRGQVNNKHT